MKSRDTRCMDGPLPYIVACSYTGLHFTSCYSVPLVSVAYDGKMKFEA
jgi:hypothetical protein